MSIMHRTVYIVSAVRTPIGKFGGAFAEFTASDLGVIAVRAALQRAFGLPLPPERVPGEGPEIDMAGILAAGAAPGDLPWRVNEVIFGNARPAGVGPNPARQIAWRAGLGDDVPALTVNMACASGLRSVMLGWLQIAAGDAEIVVAGGAESMSRVPYLLEARWGFRMGNQPLIDSMYRDGFLCQISKMLMGDTAEVLAAKYAISREEQDNFALESHRRAARAASAGDFQAEIVPIERTDKQGKVTRIESDEHIRPDVTIEALAKLPPVFAASGTAPATVTAGSSSGITDGAAAIVLVSEEKLRSLKLTPLARMVDATVSGVDPRAMGIGPVPAVRKLMARTGTGIADYGAVELNEAFAAQVLACDRELHFDRARLNPNGGAIALGHPIACSGARILATLVHHLRQPGGSKGVGNKVNRGLATLCVSGGFGVAMEIEAF